MVPQVVVQFLTLEVVQKLTLERPKGGTETNSPANTYIYIYAVKLKAGPMFALFKVKNWSIFVSENLVLPAERRIFFKPKQTGKQKHF